MVHFCITEVAKMQPVIHGDNILMTIFFRKNCRYSGRIKDIRRRRLLIDSVFRGRLLQNGNQARSTRISLILFR